MVTAVASYLAAKSRQGKWLLRIDDLDRPRCIEGMDKVILDTLEASGMYWDEDIAYQSQNNTLYEEALALLEEAYNAKSWFIIFIQIEPWYDPIRNYPRFQDIIRRMNFPG